MTKIFQKSLASVLALALCLTALITASATVSAEEATTTATLYYEVSPEAPKKGDTVTVKLKANGFDTVAGADIYSTYSENITDGVLAWGLAEGQLGVNADVSHENNTIKMILEGASQNGVLDPITTLLADGTTLYTFTFTAGEAGTEYKFGFLENDTKVRFCTSGEEKVDVTATAASVTVAEDEPEVTFTAPLKDKNVNTSFGLYAKFDFTFSGTAAEYGVMLYRAASYTDGMEVSIENADMSAAIKPTDWFSISGFNIAATGEQFAMVPYVKDNDGVYHYGSTSHVSYANYLVTKLTASTAAATSNRALALLDAYKAIYGKDLYTVSK